MEKSPFKDRIFKEGIASKGAEEFQGTILLVEDEDIILRMGKKILERLGYNVLTAKNGKDALDIYGEKKSEIDVLIVDLNMPEMGGLEMYNRMKSLNPDIKALISTGHSICINDSWIEKEGLCGILTKPYRAEEIKTKVNELIEVN